MYNNGVVDGEENQRHHYRGAGYIQIAENRKRSLN